MIFLANECAMFFANFKAAIAIFKEKRNMFIAICSNLDVSIHFLSSFESCFGNIV